MKYRILESVPAFKHPRDGYIYGIEWGVDALVLAAERFIPGPFPLKLLVWTYGHNYYGGQGRQNYASAQVHWLTYDLEAVGCRQSEYRGIFSPGPGERLSKQTLAAYGEQIASATGLYFDWRNWDRNKTLIFEEIDDSSTRYAD